MCRRLRRELRFEYLRVDVTEPWPFVESQYLPRWVLWIARSAMACTCLGTLVYTACTTPVLQFSSGDSNYSLISNDSSSGAAKPPCRMKGQFFLSYLTVWSYIVILLYFCAAVFNMTAMRRKTRSDRLSTANVICLRLQWLLCGIGCNAAVIVTVVYCGVLHPAMGSCRSNMAAAVDILMHVCNSLFMLIELATSGIAVHPLHCVFTIVYGFVYMMFSVLYWIPDHTMVMYSVILDWSHPLVPLLVFLAMALLIVPGVQLIWWLIYLLRSRLTASRHVNDSSALYQPLRAY